MDRRVTELALLDPALQGRTISRGPFSLNSPDSVRLTAASQIFKFLSSHGWTSCTSSWLENCRYSTFVVVPVLSVFEKRELFSLRISWKSSVYSWLLGEVITWKAVIFFALWALSCNVVLCHCLDSEAQQWSSIIGMMLLGLECPYQVLVSARGL